MKNLKKLGIVLILINMLILIGCNRPSTNKTTNNDVVRIGSILPLTGPASVYGEYAMSGQKKALTQLKNKNIQIVFEDGKGDPKESIAAYQKLRRDGVNVFVTTLSPICLALLPLAKADSVILFADAAHPNITKEPSQMIFRHSNTSEQESELLTNYIIDKKFVNPTIAYVNDDYGKDCAESIKERLSKISISLSLFESFEKSTTDFNVLANKIKKLNTDVIIIIGAGQNMGVLIRKIRELNVATPILANIGYVITGANQTIGENTKGISYVNFDFKKTESIKTDSTINAFETLEFGTIMLLGNAISNNGNSIKKISEYITSLENFDSGVEQMVITGNDIIPGLKIENE